ncbi:MAG: MFS transporter [Rhodospirillales bacterium]|nr:MFS transporter [Rhodospirillales bacterium]
MDEERNDAAERTAPTEEDAPPGWQATMWWMVGIQFVMTLSFSILTPIVPLFLPDLGVKNASAIDLWAGILTGITSFVAAFVSPFWGRLSDRKGRKLMLLRSSVAIGFFTVLMGISQNVWQFFAARCLMGAFAGFSASAIALVASQVPELRLGYALGWLSTGQLVGSLVGPVLGGAIADATGSYRVPFYTTAAITFAALILVARFVHESFTPPRHVGRKRSVLSNVTMLVRSPALGALFLVLLLAQFGVTTVQPVVTLFVQALIGKTATVALLAGIAFSITGLADVIASPFLGKRSDVIGYRRVLLICLAGAALASLPQAFAHSYWLFLLERFGVGCFIGGLLPTANALVGRMVARSERGTVYGMTASATFFGNSLGPMTGGGIAAIFGLRWVFVLTSLLFVANWLWVYRSVPEYVESALRAAEGRH